MQHFGEKTILGDVQMANWTFGHTELTSKIYLNDHQIIASQWAISQCSKQPLLNQVYFVVHFYPWYKPYFPLFQSFNHTLPLTSKQRKIKFQPRITMNHNLYTKEECVWDKFFFFLVTWSPKENGDGDLSNNECFLKHHRTFICSRACVAARLVMGKPFFSFIFRPQKGIMDVGVPSGDRRNWE